MIDLKEYFNGEKLYGDDFTLDQIENWYREEAEEGYDKLIQNDFSKYLYEYDNLNYYHGYSKLENRKFENVLGFGSAWGNEFDVIVDRISQLTIIEPSNVLIGTDIGPLKPNYFKPRVNGEIGFPENSFDLITCFGVLHHIPNVTFVVEELIRVLKPGGYLLLREPITSIGDWRIKRTGLTKNERGIPVHFFDSIFNKLNIKPISKNYCLTNSNFFQKALGSFFSKPILYYKWFVKFDSFISKYLSYRVKYFAKNKFENFGPQSIFYVIKK